jgi:hypothetical protein
MASAADCENPIRHALDTAGIPWRLPREELVARYGVRRHPAYDWDVIEIDTTPPFVEGLLWPLSTQVLPHCAPHVPATRFTGVVRSSDDAAENFRFAVGKLAPLLGPGETRPTGNSLEMSWESEAARLRLTVWPPAMQQIVLTNPAHQLDPRLITACLLTIDSGFRPAATDEERRWIDTFEPIAAIETGWFTDASVRQTPARQEYLEYVREPPAEVTPLFGSVGLSADRMALIFYGVQLYLIPVQDILGFTVVRQLPAKGSGGSRLEVDCRTRCAGLTAKRLSITESSGTEDLNPLAAELSGKTARPFTLGDYEYDY